jgi:hypothetical protein
MRGLTLSLALRRDPRDTVGAANPGVPRVRDRQQLARGALAPEARVVPHRARHPHPCQVPDGARRRPLRCTSRRGLRQGFPPHVCRLPRARRTAVRRRIQRPIRARRGAVDGGTGADPTPRICPQAVAPCRSGRRRLRRTPGVAAVRRRRPPRRRVAAGVQDDAGTAAGAPRPTSERCAYAPSRSWDAGSLRRVGRSSNERFSRTSESASWGGASGCGSALRGTPTRR